MALVKARQEEVRSSANSLVGGPGPDVQRWMALKSIAEARSMLQTLFRAAAQQKAQVWRLCFTIRVMRNVMWEWSVCKLCPLLAAVNCKTSFVEPWQLVCQSGNIQFTVGLRHCLHLVIDFSSRGRSVHGECFVQTQTCDSRFLHAVWAQMFEVQQSLASVRDEAEEQRERAEAAEAEAERSRQATAQAQDAAAQAFAHAGTTPRSHASPVSRRRDVWHRCCIACRVCLETWHQLITPAHH